MPIYLHNGLVLTIDDPDDGTLVADDQRCCCKCCAIIIAEQTTNAAHPDWDITVYSGEFIPGRQTKWILQEGGGVGNDCQLIHGYPGSGYQSGIIVDGYMQGLAPFHSQYPYDGHMKLIVWCGDSQ